MHMASIFSAVILAQARIQFVPSLKDSNQMLRIGLPPGFWPAPE